MKLLMDVLFFLTFCGFGGLGGFGKKLGFGTSGQDAPPTRLIKKPSFQEKTRLLGLPLLVIEEHGFPQLQFFGAVRTGGVSQKTVPQENVARVTPTIDMAVAVEVDDPLFVGLVSGEAFGSDHQVVNNLAHSALECAAAIVNSTRRLTSGQFQHALELPAVKSLFE